MATAHWELQQAIHQKLAGLPAVLALLGGAHIWDDVPRGASFPYVTFGITSEQDWSTGTEAGGEHILTLHIWSRAAGRHEVDAIADAIRLALHDQPLALAGHRLVNLRQEYAEARRDAGKELYHGVIRLRAVTEQTA